MAHKVTGKKITDYKKLYAKFERKGGQKVTTSELGEVMRSLGHDLTKPELQGILDSVQKDGSALMDFKNFLDLISQKISDSEFAKGMLDDFRKYDQNNDGYISPEELREVWVVKGERLSNAEVDAIMKRVDTNNDGKVNYKEFLKEVM